MPKHKKRTPQTQPHTPPPATEPMRTFTELYTRGDDLLTPTEYRRNFEQALASAINNRAMVAPETAARAFAVSATAYSCAEYSATVTSSIKLSVVDAEQNVIEQHPLNYFLSISARVLHDATLALLIWGRTYWRKRYNSAGYPTGLEEIKPTSIQERIDPTTGEVLYYDYRPPYGGVYQLAVKDVVYAQLYDTQPDGLGISKFEVAWRAVNVEQSLSTYAAAFFTNSARPDGLLTFDQPVSDNAYAKAKEDWKQFKGSANAHRTAVMPSGARWTPMQSPPKDLAMTELKAEERRDIGAVFGVDLALIGLAETADPLSANSTYSAKEVNHIRNVILPRLRMILLAALNEQWLHKDFVPNAHYTLSVDENSIPALAEANLNRAETGVNLSDASILDYNEARGLLGYPEREGFLLRNSKEALSLWAGSALTLNHLYEMIGLQSLGVNGDVVLIGGTLYPVSRLAEVAGRNADLIGKSPFDLLTPPPTAPKPGIQVTTPEPLQLPETISRAEPKKAYSYLSLPNDPAILAVQDELRYAFQGIEGVEWQEPEHFHVTLVYCSDISDEALKPIGRASFTHIVDIKSTQIGMFHNEDEISVHLVVDLVPGLQALQSDLYDLFKAQGADVSEYSAPANYHPHITLAYMPAVPSLPDVDVNVLTDRWALELSRADYQVVASTKPSRNARSMTQEMEIALSFADHAFVRSARRELSQYLTDRDINPAWVPAADWRLTLSRSTGSTPSQAAALVREVDYATGRKLDLRAGGYFQRGRGIYLHVDDNDALMKLRRSALLDSETVGARGVEGERGILVATYDGDIDLSDAPRTAYPLVGSNVSLRTGRAEVCQWTLRGLPPAQERELRKWEHIVRRRGPDYAFETDVLTRTSVGEFVRLALDADVSIDDTFGLAEEILRGAVVWRAYPDTRDTFVAEVRQIIGDAQGSTIDRRNFSARMRTVLRRLGLQAFREGIEAGGREVESLSQDDLEIYRVWQAQSSDYVTKLGTEVYNQGITENEIAVRAEMWANKSLDDIHNAGLRIGAPGRQATWRYDPENEHCTDCQQRHGQTMSIDDWGKIGFPRDSRLECGGWFCGCDLTDPETGNVIGWQQ